MRRDRRADRNRQIFLQSRVCAANYALLGEIWGLTPERIRQVIEAQERERRLWRRSGCRRVHELLRSRVLLSHPMPVRRMA